MTKHRIKRDQVRESTAIQHEYMADVHIRKHGMHTAQWCNEARAEAACKALAKELKKKGPR